MPKNFELKKIFTGTDIVTIAIMIIGFLIAAFSDEIAVKVIGFSIAILGIVRLILFIGQRVNAMVESNKLRPKSQPIDLEVTEKKDRKAKRVVIENFIKPKKDKEEKKEDFTKEIRDEEGFRLIQDDANQETQQQVEPEPTPQPELQPSIGDVDLEFEDELSSVKIVNKGKPQSEATAPQAEPLPEKPKVEPREEIVINKSYKGKKIEIPLTELIDIEPAFGNEPRKEFEYFLKRVLKLVRSVTNTTSAVFILVNYDRKQIVVEANDSDIPSNIALRKKIPFGNDIVTQIIDSLKPEILTEIYPNAELDLIPYYIEPAHTASFFGMPVFYEEALVGVLCLDSKEANAYDLSLVNLFGQFAKLISSLVKSYTEKYDLMQDSRTLDAVNKFREMVKETDFSLDKIYEALLSSAVEDFDNMLVGIIGYNKESQWEVQHVRNLNCTCDVELGTLVEDDRSLTGQTLYRNRISAAIPLRINDFRFNSQEEKQNDGFFIAIPISSFSNTFGALFIQGINPADLTEYDVKILSTLCSHAATAVEQIHFTQIVKNSALFDLSTGLLNTPAFTQRLNEEVMRSSDFGYPMTLCLVEIDKYKALDPEIHQERYEQVLTHVVDIMHQNIRPYDLLGRVESNIFGVVLIDVDSAKAKMWAEKLRSEIAISVLKIGQDSFTVTVSMGLAQLGKDEAIDDVVENALEMLNLSKQKTNTITVYE